MRFISRIAKNPDPSVSRDRWIIPYADLVTILLALFIVLFAAADEQRAKVIASALKGIPDGGNGVLPGRKTPETKNENLSILNNPLIAKKAQFRSSRKSITVSLPDTALFAPGESEVTDEAKETLRILSEELSKMNGGIRVEGHTDSTPISNQRFKSNWELSTTRASSVLSILINFGVKPHRLSASGYGGFRPIADNKTREGRSRNRRVDLVIERNGAEIPTLAENISPDR